MMAITGTMKERKRPADLPTSPIWQGVDRGGWWEGSEKERATGKRVKKRGALLNGKEAGQSHSRGGLFVAGLIPGRCCPPLCLCASGSRLRICRRMR